MSPNQLVRANDAKALKAVKKTLQVLAWPDNYQSEEELEEETEIGESNV